MPKDKEKIQRWVVSPEATLDYGAAEEEAALKAFNDVYFKKQVAELDKVQAGIDKNVHEIEYVEILLAGDVDKSEAIQEISVIKKIISDSHSIAKRGTEALKALNDTLQKVLAQQLTEREKALTSGVKGMFTELNKVNKSTFDLDKFEINRIFGESPSIFTEEEIKEWNKLKENLGAGIKTEIVRLKKAYDDMPSAVQRASGTKDFYVRQQLKIFLQGNLKGTVNLAERQEHFIAAITTKIEAKKDLLTKQYAEAQQKVNSSIEKLSRTVDDFEKKMDVARLARVRRSLEALKVSISNQKTTFLSTIATLWTFKKPSTRRAEKIRKINGYIDELKRAEVSKDGSKVEETGVPSFKEILQEVEGYVKDSGEKTVLKQEDLNAGLGTNPAAETVREKKDESAVAEQGDLLPPIAEQEDGAEKKDEPAKKYKVKREEVKGQDPMRVPPPPPPPPRDRLLAKKKDKVEPKVEVPAAVKTDDKAVVKKDEDRHEEVKGQDPMRVPPPPPPPPPRDRLLAKKKDKVEPKVKVHAEVKKGDKKDEGKKDEAEEKDKSAEPAVKTEGRTELMAAIRSRGQKGGGADLKKVEPVEKGKEKTEEKEGTSVFSALKSVLAKRNFAVQDDRDDLDDEPWPQEPTGPVPSSDEKKEKGASDSTATILAATGARPLSETKKEKVAAKPASSKEARSLPEPKEKEVDANSTSSKKGASTVDQEKDTKPKGKDAKPETSASGKGGMGPGLS